MNTAPPLPTYAGTVLDPFAVLDLSPDPDLTDEQVHIAWQRQLAATGGQASTPADAAAITSAYEALRSAVRRADALDSLYAYWDTADQAAAPSGRTGGERQGRHEQSVTPHRQNDRPAASQPPPT